MASRGKKAFDIHANSYRIDADVVPTFELRRYAEDGTYIEGVGFTPDGGSLIQNWPQQNYDRGVKRNDDTSRYYKRIIRILKRLRNRMQEEKVAGSENISSFLIECLVWNAPLEAFQRDTYTSKLRAVLMHTFNATIEDKTCSEWGEVNELKYLFRTSQPWTRQQANTFLNAVWNYVGYT